MADAPAATREADADAGPAQEDHRDDALTTPAEERGTLDVRTRAVSKIAQHAAGEVAGTVRSGSTLARTSGGALGTSYPDASSRIDAGQASISLDVAVLWPAPIAQVAAEARDHVLRRTRELSGIDVRHVDVKVHVVSADSTRSEKSDDDRRRVR